jgi:NAD(P)-dependent dehydrogenase (short-subunit alcohol dehydrogenase family)
MNIIITGASRGIGFETAQFFLKNNHQVFCLTRNTESLESLSYSNLEIISTDLTSTDSIDRAVKIIKAKVNHIDVVIHNAGSIINKPFEKIDFQELEIVYKVNVLAPFYLTQKLMHLLGRHSKAHIVNISSMGGFQGSAKFAGLSAYSSSKAAITGLTECLAEEFKEKNISVNCLALGAVQTEMLEEAFPGYQAPVTPNQMANYIYDFALNGHNYFNGKILPVSSSTP